MIFAARGLAGLALRGDTATELGTRREAGSSIGVLHDLRELFDGVVRPQPLPNVEPKKNIKRTFSLKVYKIRAILVRPLGR